MKDFLNSKGVQILGKTQQKSIKGASIIDGSGAIQRAIKLPKCKPFDPTTPYIPTHEDVKYCEEY